MLREMQEGGPTQKALELLADRKLHALFELWDSDGDGAVSFAEICHGLSKFQPLVGKKVRGGETERHEPMLLKNLVVTNEFLQMSACSMAVCLEAP